MSNGRSLQIIAREITADWKAQKKTFPTPMPYLQAMRSLVFVSDRYAQDSGKSIVLYFLSNASTWRGPEARRIKAELNRLVG